MLEETRGAPDAFDGALVKPVELSALLAAVREYLPGAEEPREASGEKSALGSEDVVGAGRALRDAGRAAGHPRGDRRRSGAQHRCRAHPGGRARLVPRRRRHLQGRSLQGDPERRARAGALHRVLRARGGEAGRPLRTPGAARPPDRDAASLGRLDQRRTGRAGQPTRLRAAPLRLGPADGRRAPPRLQRAAGHRAGLDVVRSCAGDLRQSGDEALGRFCVLAGIGGRQPPPLRVARRHRDPRDARAGGHRSPRRPLRGAPGGR